MDTDRHWTLLLFLLIFLETERICINPELPLDSEEKNGNKKATVAISNCVKENQRNGYKKSEVDNIWYCNHAYHYKYQCTCRDI